MPALDSEFLPSSGSVRCKGCIVAALPYHGRVSVGQAVRRRSPDDWRLDRIMAKGFTSVQSPFQSMLPLLAEENGTGG